ncbi:MAG: hypothetical protein JOZ41_12075 [Chloroflexi bacterium]|nr:hypothetical protein [Chloroflexota bacterium]
MSYRLHPNRVAIGFRLLARNLAIGRQIAEDTQRVPGRPETIREPRAFRAEQVDGLGVFAQRGRLLQLRPLDPGEEQRYHLPWADLDVQVAA